MGRHLAPGITTHLPEGKIAGKPAPTTRVQGRRPSVGVSAANPNTLLWVPAIALSPDPDGRFTVGHGSHPDGSLFWGEDFGSPLNRGGAGAHAEVC